MLRGNPAARTKPLFWEWRFKIAGHPINRCPQLAMRDGGWKLLMNPDRSRVELYDILKDHSETDNVADQHAAVVAKMSKRLLDWAAQLPKGPTEQGAGSNAYPFPVAK